MHAIPANPEMVKTFLSRAKEIDAAKLALPAKVEADKAVFASVNAAHDALPAVKDE